MKHIFRNLAVCLTLITTVGGGILLVAPTSAAALKCNILPQSICNSAKSNAKVTDGSDGSKTVDTSSTGIFKLLVWVLKILTALVGVAAIAAIIYAGVMYSSAGDNSSQVSKAKSIIRDTIIGIVAYGLMFLFLNWLIPGGVIQ